MKFCKEHWDMLREAIRSRGMWGLVASSGEEVVSKVVSELKEGEKRSNFEPLMGAHNAIVSNVLDLCGVELLFENADGTEKCPICFIQAEHDAHCKDPDCKAVKYVTWIDRAADDMLAEAKKLGLMGEG